MLAHQLKNSGIQHLPKSILVEVLRWLTSSERIRGRIGIKKGDHRAQGDQIAPLGLPRPFDLSRPELAESTNAAKRVQHPVEQAPNSANFRRLATRKLRNKLPQSPRSTVAPPTGPEFNAFVVLPTGTSSMPPPPAPTAVFSAAPVSILSGQSSSLSWTTSNASSVSITPGVGAVPAYEAIVLNVGAAETLGYTAFVDAVSGRVLVGQNRVQRLAEGGGITSISAPVETTGVQKTEVYQGEYPPDQASQCGPCHGPFTAQPADRTTEQVIDALRLHIEATEAKAPA